MVDIYRDAKRRGIYPPLFTATEGALRGIVVLVRKWFEPRSSIPWLKKMIFFNQSCFSIYQTRLIKKRFFNFFLWNFCEMTRHFSLGSQNSEYPRIFRVTGANQNARKLLSTDLVNTKKDYGYAFQMFKVDRCEFKSVRVSTRLHQSFFWDTNAKS